MEVIVKALSANSWSGIHTYPGCGNVIRPYFTRTGKLYTGLTIADGVSKETFERLQDATGENLKPNGEFWKTFQIRLGADDIILRPQEDPYDEIKYLFLKKSKYCKSSISENKPSANYYLYNPIEESEVANKHNRVKRNAIKEFDKMNATSIKKALRLYGYSTTDISDSVAEDRLYGLVEQNPENFMKKWVNNETRATEYLIKEAIAKDVIRKSGNSFTFGTITLGRGLHEAINFIDNKENSDIKASIINDAKIK